jgi:AraC family transcriptional regulator
MDTCIGSSDDISREAATPSALLIPEISPPGGRRFADERALPLLSIVRLLDRAGEALASDKSGAHRHIQIAAALLRAQSESNGGQGACSPGTGRRALAPWQVDRATRFIDANLHKKITISDIAELTRLSASHFSRAFRATVGEAPHAYIMRRRVERAQHMIRVTNQPLAEIALECGFSDQAHLTKLFGRVVGICPGAWRRMQGGRARQLAA